MRDAAATRQRILDAATAEFAEFGIAGARVDRIVASARSNKSQLYAYFTNKELLFDAVLEAHLDELTHDVPLDGHDLAAYAVNLYDAVLAKPSIVRLATWRRVEQISTGHLFADVPSCDEPKVAAIAAAQEDGTLDDRLQPLDILCMLNALSLTWSPVSTMIAASTDEPAAEHDRRRQALCHVVNRAFAAQKSTAA